jgi:stage II sporulation protein D
MSLTPGPSPAPSSATPTEPANTPSPVPSRRRRRLRVLPGSRRVAVVAAVVGGLLGAVVNGLPASQPAEAAAAALSTVTVSGKGNGHGYGMSQYGAYGAAKAGLTAAQITGFYYPGTALTQQGDPLIRVALTALDGGVPNLIPLPGSSVVGSLQVSGDGKVVPLPAAAKWRAIPGTGVINVQKPVGAVWGTYTSFKGAATFSSSQPLRVAFGKAKATCRRWTEATVYGSVRHEVAAGRARTVAVMRTEQYLRGVVPGEMPSSWSAAAVQSQAIAARSYATFQHKPANYYDVVDTTGDQCWEGASAHVPATDTAIKATAGLVRSVGGKPIFAQFSASNGGYTNQGSQPYLVSKADPYEAYTSNPYANWTAKVSTGPLAARDGSGGLTVVTGVRVTKRRPSGAWGGRATEVVVDGRTASGAAARITLTGAAFTSLFGLRSTYYNVTA